MRIKYISGIDRISQILGGIAAYLLNHFHMAFLIIAFIASFIPYGCIQRPSDASP